MDSNQKLERMKSRVLDLIQTLKNWNYPQADSRKNLHLIGDELSEIQARLTGMWRDTAFPSFVGPAADSAPGVEQSMALRRRDLVSLVARLAPSNFEILEWLGEKEDKETAFLYAYARGSVSEPSLPLKKEFFERVERIIDENPVLAEANRVDAILQTARTRFALCQSKAYENMN
jgi:hypothetical protein